jgi:hypothetical protein
LSLPGVDDIMQTEIYKTDILVPEPSAFELPMTIEIFKGYKSPGNDQIPEGLIGLSGITLCSLIHKLIFSMCNSEKLPQPCKE